jgi:diaminohydroxyphosphoribosylaminopyrimidine deaminase/5-amino-6-(5-phosphoribosylamino)uracil reductase
MNQDERIMKSALKLARRGIGSVEPNPAVGAVIVKGDRVIGKGWHKKFGGPHAEINALQDCDELGIDPRGAVMYVTLEPCSHHGKTGPCTDAVISAGLAKVVIAMIDPSRHAAGEGVRRLRNAGIEVRTGVCENQARLLNAPFVKYAATGRCWVTLKWAQSIDGKLALNEPRASERGWISGRQSRKDVHYLRRRAGAILVGVNTVIADDPLLTARPARGKKALRIVLDSQLRIPLDCRLVKTAGEHPLLICTTEGAVLASPEIAEMLSEQGAEVIARPHTHGLFELGFLLDELSKRGIAHMLVEGGPKVLTSFLKQDLADEIVVYIAPEILGSHGSADIAGPMADLPHAVALHHVDIESFDGDVRLTGLAEKALNEISVSTDE